MHLGSDAPEPKRKSRPGPTSIRAQLCVVPVSPPNASVMDRREGGLHEELLQTLSPFGEVVLRGFIYPAQDAGSAPGSEVDAQPLLVT